MPALFLVAGGGLAYLLLYHFMPGGPGSAQRNANHPPADVKADPGNGSAEKPPAPSSAERTPDTPTPPQPAPTETVRAAPVSPPTPPPNDSAAVAAEEALEYFFRATSLGARLPMMEPAYQREKLVGTVFDGPMPEATSIASAPPDRNDLEDYTNYPFRVTFRTANETTDDVLVVVRKRGDNPPRVLVDPLLDLLGGRLAKFASEPGAEASAFRAIIEPMPRCFEPDIPNPDRKFTYKLSSTDHGGEIARAYASLNSPLAEQLFTPDSQIRWGKRIRATVVLSWNVEENPDQPYIELVEIKDLNWSP
ncbi:hypothetical protein HAHE_12120 [Haloferula helveola]|uniref:Uncharacterized protein n=2 Tax=Haloferula helveola TaxID=490095 RepID=A0ABM7RB23_9BACT|nr:hypothetical protein HAHE_12120 [Haloferula helveola]